MSISILTEYHSPKVAKVKKDYNVFRVITMKMGNLNIIEFFNHDGSFRGFGKDTKQAFKKAKKVIKKYYN